MKHIKLFEQFIAEKKAGDYIAYIDDKRSPGGTDKEIMNDYSLQVMNRTRTGFEIMGALEDIEAFIADYNIILDEEPYMDESVTNEAHNIWEPVENAPSPKAYKSRSGNYIINMTAKKLDGTINKIVKKPKSVEGEGYQILADDKGSIVFFELTNIAQEVAVQINGEVISTVTLANGTTESASSRGGSFIIIK